MLLRRFGIGPRAAVSFALIAGLLLFTGLFSLNRMSVINQASTVISEDWLPGVQMSGRLQLLSARFRLQQFAHILTHDEAGMSAVERRLQEVLGELEKVENDLFRTASGSEETALLERFRSQRMDYLKAHESFLAISRADRTDDAFASLNGMAPQFDAMRQTAEEIAQLNGRGGEAASAAADEQFASSQAAVIVSLVLAAALTALLAWMLTRSIVGPLGDAVEVARTVAKGDLTGRIDVKGEDEPAQLMQALADMQQQLRRTIQQIGGSATQLASAAEELSAVTEESNRSLIRQNDEIQMAATAVNQMTAAVEEVARNASSTSEASNASAESAGQGRDRVRQTIAAIRRMGNEVNTTATLVSSLAEQAQNISKVLDVIRSIAEQTNLLALNAAIEAARAGEQGRGFAVVADEVRALAHRTQESTLEIEQMIGSIQEGTNQAVDAMNSSSQRALGMQEEAEAAGQAIEVIAQQVEAINERTLVIASAAEEQAQVAREVDRNLVNIRDLSLQTSAGANQTAAASQELSRLAVELNTMVTRFVV